MSPRTTLLRLANSLLWSLGFSLAMSASVAKGQSGLESPASSFVISTTPYNLQVVASEQLINRFVARQDAEPGVIQDFVFGAQVNGEQFTSRRVWLDLQPASDIGSATFILEGEVNSRTIGRTEQGSVQSIGRQNFRAEKPVYFDGDQLSTRHALVFARAENQPVAASTQFDGTLLEGLGRKIALSRAIQQRPQAEEYARGRVAERVYPAFEQAIDEQLGQANGQLKQTIRPRLEAIKLLPLQQRVRSTESHLHYAARLAIPATDVAEIPVPRRPLAGPFAGTVYIHESLLNSLVDRVGLNGRTTSDRELRELIGQARRTLGGIEEAPRAGGLAASIETTIEFDRDRPLRFFFREQEMVVELRATFRPAGQSLLPPLKISIPLRLIDQGADWELVRGEIGLQSGSDQPLPAAAEMLIRQAIEGDFPDVRLPKLIPLPPELAAKMSLSVVDLQSADGWLAVSID